MHSIGTEHDMSLGMPRTYAWEASGEDDAK